MHFTLAHPTVMALVIVGDVLTVTSFTQEWHLKTPHAT